MADYYAWSRFKKKVNEWGRVEEWINPGDKVTRQALSVSQDEWDTLVESGAVRTAKYPDIANHVSPAEATRAGLAPAAAAELSEPQVPEPPPPDE